MDHANEFIKRYHTIAITYLTANWTLISSLERWFLINILSITYSFVYTEVRKSVKNIVNQDGNSKKCKKLQKI